MRLHWLLPNRPGVPVLMYHRVWPGLRDGLTVTPDDLRAQWTWLRDQGYTCLRLEDFLAGATGKTKVPEKSFLLTFDDGYRNNLEYALPLLKEFGWEATIFIIAGTLDGTMRYGEDDSPGATLTVEEMKAMTCENIQFALHGYHHENFSENSLPALKQAMEASCRVFEQFGIPYLRVLAYPYGARPAEANEFRELKEWMKDYGIEAAFRIGNRPQKLPAADTYELMRIDIRGEDSLKDFQIKLRKGKLKPF
jgi:peptidoglycan/xylan/chitin deacetylase (PgdA/CDA1 family)